MIEKADRRDHSPAARERPSRPRTTAIILHHLAIDVDKDGIDSVEDAIAFFVHDPEGIATVTLGGSYASKAPTIAAWKRDGVPALMQSRGFVPYHFLIDSGGAVSRMLPLEALGAHAGNWNDRSVGVACLGDFSKGPPSDAEIAAVNALVADIRSVYPEAEILGHDETIIRDGGTPKGCPGPFFPLEAVRTAAA